MNVRFLFNTSAIVELLTGLSLLLVPGLVVSLMLGSDLDPAGFAVARLLGAALLALGMATLESRQRPAQATTRAGLCAFNLVAAALLAYFGTAGKLGGPMLWPITVFHGLLGLAMVRFTRNPAGMD